MLAAVTRSRPILARSPRARIYHAIMRTSEAAKPQAAEIQIALKRAMGPRPPTPAPLAPNDRWSLDFVSGQFICGRRFRPSASYFTTAFCPTYISATRNETGSSLVDHG
jgi:hypothetical protein